MRGLAVLLGALALVGCGGSKTTASTSTPAIPPTTPPVTTTTSRTPTQASTTSTTHTTKTTAKTTTTGSINVRVPARYTILPDGSVAPPTVTIPAHLPVELIVVSNARAHRITLRTTTLEVRAHAQAEALIGGLPTGAYALKVDGAPKAVLAIGGSPGP